MLSPLIHTWNLNLGYAKRLVADIPDEPRCVGARPSGMHG